LRTVLSYLQERATSLQPFLFNVAILATPRILAIIGAQMGVTGDTLSSDRLRQVMIDLGAAQMPVPFLRRHVSSHCSSVKWHRGSCGEPPRPRDFQRHGSV